MSADQQANDRLFKKLTPSNWQKPDGTAGYIKLVKADGSQRALSPDDWATEILHFELSSNVPEDVHYLFEVAQGVLCYGCFFYPLYTLGCEQLYRVLEAALTHRCRQLGAPTRKGSFEKKIKWMNEQGAFDEDRLRRWTGVRNLRNDTSHPKSQNLLLPTDALWHLDVATTLINELFQDD